MTSMAYERRRDDGTTYWINEAGEEITGEEAIRADMAIGLPVPIVIFTDEDCRSIRERQ